LLVYEVEATDGIKNEEELTKSCEAFWIYNDERQPVLRPPDELSVLDMGDDMPELDPYERLVWEEKQSVIRFANEKTNNQTREKRKSSPC